jgi:hypothetical protein
MLSITKESKLRPEAVIKRAVDFFGPKGYGLQIKEQAEDTVYLEGGGGGVRIYAVDSKKGSKVDVETREWESQVKDFLTSIK